jgi:antirestriction protein ArdC
MNAKVYEIITERIIERLEAGVVPWRQPWRKIGAPRNLVSSQEYRGINVFVLASMGYDSPYWLTWHQLKGFGGTVRKGQKACPVVLWKWRDCQTDEVDSTGAPVIDSRPLLRYYSVFNVLQCDGIAEHIPEADHTRPAFDPITAADAVASGMPLPPTVEHGFRQACYMPVTDVVRMPQRESFAPAESYYSTLFHELVHSTGNTKRLARKGITESTQFGSEEYSQEELVAEMGAAFLCGQVSIEPATLDNSAAYIQSWLEKLRGDSRLVVQAAAQAQKAADFILGRQHHEAGTPAVPCDSSA